MMGILKEFREFAVKGNAVDMAVGIILGAAFGGVVTSIVNDLMMPTIGMLVGGTDFSNLKLVLKDAQPAVLAVGNEPAKAAVAEVALKYGAFANVLLNFVIVAFCLFMVVKGMNKLRTVGVKPAGKPS